MSPQSNFRPIQPDALYRLLPAVVQSTDPNGAILSYMAAQAGEHNFLGGKMAGLSKLQDPSLVGKFSPEDFGESSGDFALFLSDGCRSGDPRGR